ncbi:MAG: tRNA (adenosine(37)-N6)-threonylcarbamoyltransferase complex dimerization subunit type 1 TsaB [Gaiellaceae bacterium]|nr:tRNA (adenosine(37)-N6)-threonylcarbamoyltransferase complex dimerization subunit type 1 TsaB [Gaiellaceae bacterium]
MTLILGLDSATDVATCALVRSGEVLGERWTIEARRLLEEVDALLGAADVAPDDLDALVVGLGPGSFTSTRMGIALARGLALALDLPLAGVSTLDALAAARPGAIPVIDAKRREVFVPGPQVLAPDELALEPGTTCIGSGAIRYRATLEAKGAIVPADADPVHIPHARLHVALATSFGRAEDVEPLYVRVPDATARERP